MKKILTLFILFATYFNAAYATLTTSHLAANTLTPGHFLDVVYNWPSPVSDAEVFITVRDVALPSSYYWSHFFFLSGSSSSSPTSLRQAYLGLQTHSDSSKTALFSIWNAIAASGSNCSQFGGEGVGYNCSINYNFQNGGLYRMRVAQVSSDSTGDWWGAWVQDAFAQVETFIGYIKSPPQSGLITSSFLFDEYFGTVASCSTTPFAQVTFSGLVGNGGAIKPRLSQTLPEGPCANDVFVNFVGNDFTVSTPTTTPTLNVH